MKLLSASKLLFSAAALLSALSVSAVPEGMEVHDGWKFKQARLTNWYPATVPGVVHTDLMANEIIEDPFYRLNERGVQWVDKEDWIYETTFDLPEGIFGKDNIRIEFMGLDTYADVYLNEQKIIAADNMFRRWEADIKEHAKEKDNVLKVYFHSPVKIDLPKLEALPFRYFADNDQAANGGLLDKKILPFARKAGYHYGWDWGPRLMTAGIWRPVRIEGWNDARIADVQFLQEGVTAKSAKVTAVVEVIADKAFAGAQVTVADEKTGAKMGTAKADLKEGLNKVAVTFTMKNPKLWWSNGLGKAHLYNFKTTVARGGRTLDSDSDRIGIRSIEMVREKDGYGSVSLYFVLNGVKVFAKGANYIPNDNFLPRVTRERYEKVVGDAAEININMLRIWGGGIYEDDVFYDLCDEHGILIWQDFMNSCTVYPAEGALLENMRQEAIDNVRRLRNHPCIALWCGGNECQDAWLGWGWKRRLTEQNPEYAETVWRQFEQQHYVVLPAVVEEHGSGIAYVPDSPFSDYGIKSNGLDGDRHYWDIWHGRKPITNYNIERSRFFSEYGFQSFPAFESVKKFTLPKDWGITTEVMMWHQRGGAHANGLIETYLQNEYFTPKDFPSFLYVSHILQGDAIKTAIEAHRRDMGYCMGTLYWQLNDCWPVASWSGRDWYGNWKALHYFARYAFADILVSPIEKDEAVEFHIVSDRLSDTQGTLTVEVVAFDGSGVVNTFTHKVRAKANSVTNDFSVPVAELLGGKQRGDVVIHAVFEVDGRQYANNYFLGRQKEMNYPEVAVTCDVKPAAEGYEVTLRADKFARGVFLTVDGTDHHFSDNYFDLLPGRPRTVTVTTGLTPAEFDKQLRVVSLADAR